MGIGGYIPPNLHIGIKRERVDCLIFNILMGQILFMLLLTREKKSVSATWEVPEIALYKSSASSRMLLKPDSDFHQMAPNHSRNGFNSSHQTVEQGRPPQVIGHLLTLLESKPLFYANLYFEGKLLR